MTAGEQQGWAVEDSDIRLDRWLRRRTPHLTQGAIQKWCRTGQIRVDGLRVEPSCRLQPGQSVRVPPLPVAPAPVSPTSAIDPYDAAMLRRAVLYQDDQVIVLDKPPGLPTQGGLGIARHVDGMLDCLRREGDTDRPRLVHRLDRDTSGVLLLARHAASAARLAAAFRGRDVRKTYWAIVAGRPVPVEGEIDLPLMRAGGAHGERTVPANRRDPAAASAYTNYRTLDHAAREFAWLELQPRTGRTHQLRVHCAALDTPILGDGKYGGTAAHRDGLSGKLHLHARALRLPHPSGGWLEVEADLPAHMRETFHTLGFHAAATRPPRRG